MSLNNEVLLEGESRLHCGSVYHLIRLTGLGSDLVLPLYDVSMRVAYKSGDFFIRMSGDAESYFSCHRNQLYNAAARLVESGFWSVLRQERGKAVHYHPLSHEDWVSVHGDAACCKKAVMPWDEEGKDPLGPALYGVTGGAEFFPQVLAGWRSKAGVPDEVLVERAKKFMEQAGAVNPQSRTFRKALGAFLCKSDVIQ
jgi:hypothetical protein